MLATLATVTASTKRPPAISGGKRGAPAAHLDAIKITPLVPGDPNDAKVMLQRTRTGTPTNLLEAFANGAVDVVAGDVLVVGGAEYQVVAAHSWSTFLGMGDYTRIIVEAAQP